MRVVMILAALLLTAMPASAAPRVVVSLAPLHSLVAGIMEGVGTPELLVRGGASPHAYAQNKKYSFQSIEKSGRQ